MADWKSELAILGGKLDRKKSHLKLELTHIPVRGGGLTCGPGREQTHGKSADQTTWRSSPAGSGTAQRLLSCPTPFPPGKPTSHSALCPQTPQRGTPECHEGAHCAPATSERDVLRSRGTWVSRAFRWLVCRVLSLREHEAMDPAPGKGARGPFPCCALICWKNHTMTSCV